MRFILALTLALSGGVSNEPLNEKEAYIWYLGHSGWAIQTKSHLLIFDYWEREDPKGERALVNGHIRPEEIQDQNVIVFVSHGHGDHFDPRIFEWKDKVPNITYVFGWQAEKDPEFIYCGAERETFDISGVKVKTIYHDFDGIPESAFLIELDGLTIFHSGDHGNGPPPFKEPFVDNVNYLSKIAPEIDMAFIPIWGEESFVVDKLTPTFTFPMHDLGREHQYKKFRDRAEKEKMPTRVICAEKKGDRFFFTNGDMKPE
jgi:L-ascorbate metabolism protein UlaG (beta-lactamase superfamily)